MEYSEIIQQVSEQVGLPKTFVDKVYRSYWRAVREHIVSLPLKDALSDEEFLKLRPNVNIPSIGKLYVTLDRYRRLKNMFEKYKQLREQEINQENNQDNKKEE